MAVAGVVLCFCLCNLFLTLLTVTSLPAADPIKCSTKNTACTITNSFGSFTDRSTCRAANVVYPTTEQELISIIANATISKQKMKVATLYYHSIGKLVCPDGQDGLLISTKYLNHVLNIDVSTKTITVESGVTLRQLVEEAAKAGLALPYTPYWWGLTMGGIIATGAHGSSLWDKGGSVRDYVVQLRIVSPGGPEDGYVKVRTLDESNSDLSAAKTSLGVLGVISQITLQLQPMFKRSVTFVTKDDAGLADEAVNFGHQHEFADISWFPSQRTAIYRVDDRFSGNGSASGVCDYLQLRGIDLLTLAGNRNAEENQELTNDADGKCDRTKTIISTYATHAFGFTNDGVTFTGYPVIGNQNRIQTSGSCLDSTLQDQTMTTACPWDPRVKGDFVYQTALIVSLSVVKDFIQDMQELVALNPKALCGAEIYSGILMRYLKASTAYLGLQEDSIIFDFTYYRSKEPGTPRLFEDILEEIEQMAYFKYGALPHWGKNRNVAFIGAIKKFRKAGEFLRVKGVYDPLGLFSNEWTDQVLGLKNGLSIVKEGCAIEGLCICSEDSHCAPKMGYYCRPGQVYKDARVCTRVTSHIAQVTPHRNISPFA